MAFSQIHRLRSELELLQRSNHENILRVFGWSKWRNSMGLIMEYMSGGNLRQLLMNPGIPLSPSLRLRMSTEIANGISFIHNFTEQRRLVHGDLKPDNILLSKELNCKIADFGGAKLIKYTRSTETQPNARTSQLTLVYAAPERLSERCRPRKEHDTYSFGVIVHGILSRETPFEVFTGEVDYVESVKRGERPDTEAIEDLKADLSSTADGKIIEELESVMTSCWSHNPASRPSMIDVRNELTELLNQQSLDAISRSVAAAQSEMKPFLPSKRLHRCISLRCFNTRSGSFHESEGWFVHTCGMSQMFIKSN